MISLKHFLLCSAFALSVLGLTSSNAAAKYINQHLDTFVDEIVKEDGLESGKWNLAHGSVHTLYETDAEYEGVLIDADGSSIDIEFRYDESTQKLFSERISNSGSISNDGDFPFNAQDVLQGLAEPINKILEEDSTLVHLEFKTIDNEIIAYSRVFTEIYIEGTVVNTLNGETIHMDINQIDEEGQDQHGFSFHLDEISGYKDNSTLEEIDKRGVQEALKSSDWTLEGSFLAAEITDFTGGELITDYAGVQDPHQKDLGMIQVLYHVSKDGHTELSAFAYSGESTGTASLTIGYDSFINN